MLIKELWSQEDARRLAEFERAARTKDVPGALFAVERASDDDEKRGRVLLERWADRAANYYSRGRVEAPADALRWVLVDELDFRGDPREGLTVGGSYLSQVIRSRRGLPILLSSIWMMVGRFAGFDVDGIGLPGHFIVRVSGGTSDAELVDPFGGGPRLSGSDCKRLVRDLTDGRVSWDDAFLEPTSVDDLLERVLRNLCNAFLKEGDTDSLYRSLRFIAALKPEAADIQLSLARLHEELGATELATTGYQRVIDDFASTREARFAEQRLARNAAANKLRN
jgi:regulator of sirC expression with transglutaminase-like and TPR domain